MTKGLPASGKTTWAKTQNAYRINKDDLRAMMNNGKWSKTNEKYILLVRDNIIELHLKDKNNVIVDDTNLHPKHEIRLQELAKKYKAEFEVKDFTGISLEDCIKRDQKKSNYVGEKVIKQMYNQFLKSKIVKIEYDKELPDAVICDIDGTLALFGGANPYDRDFSKDQLNLPIRDILYGLQQSHKIILLSGRMEKNKKITEDWLSCNGISFDKLYMRITDDVRKDFIIKKEIYTVYIKGQYNIKMVIDDRNQVVDMWRSLGLTCLQVAEGDF